MSDGKLAPSRRRSSAEPSHGPAGAAFAAQLDLAAERLRDANHAAVRGWASVADCDASITSAADLVDRLPQALMHVAGSLRAAVNRSFDDRGGQPETTVELARQHLDHAASEIAACAHRLRGVHSTISHLGEVTD